MTTLSAELVTQGAGAALTRTPLSAVTRVGAAAENELCLGQVGVAPHHARVVREDTGFFVEAAADTVVSVNGAPAKRVRLDNLDVLTLSAGVDLVFLQRELQGGQQAAAQPDAPRGPAASPAPAPSAASASAIASVTLEWTNGPDQGVRVPVPRGELIVGRGESCGLSVNTPALSRTHARITFTGDVVTVADAGSANGTAVNDRRIEGIAVVGDGDRITFGQLRTVKVHIQETRRSGDARPPSFPALDPRKSGALDPGTVLDLQWRSKLIWSPEDRGADDLTPGRGLEAPLPPASPIGPDVDASPKTAFSGPGSGPGGITPPILPDFQERAGDRTNFAAGGALAPPVLPNLEQGPKTVFARPEGGIEPPPPGISATLPPDEAETVFGAAPAAPSGPPAGPAGIAGMRLTGPSGTYTIQVGRSTVGRAVDADLKLASRTISRSHAVLEVTATTVAVEDLGGENGTEVNGVRISGRRPLETGDRLAFAEEAFTVEILRDEQA